MIDNYDDEGHEEAQIDVGNEAEMDSLAERYGVSPQRLRSAVEAVGASLEDVEIELGRF